MDRNNIVENIIEQANDRIEKFKPIEAIGINIGWSNGHLSQLRVSAKPLSE